MITFLMMSWTVAMLHLLLAMPLFWLVQWRGRVNWVTSAAGGAMIGALPVSLLAAATPLFGNLQGDLLAVALCALAGLVGGLTFRAVLRRPETVE